MQAADHITKTRSTAQREGRKASVQTKSNDVERTMHRPLGNAGMLAQQGNSPVQRKCGACGEIEFEKEKQLQLKSNGAPPSILQREEQREEQQEELLQTKGKDASAEPLVQVESGSQKRDLKNPNAKSEAKKSESKSSDSKIAQAKESASKELPKKSSTAILRKCKACEDEEKVQTKPVLQREEQQEEMLQSKRAASTSTEPSDAGTKGGSKPAPQSAPSPTQPGTPAPGSTAIREARAFLPTARRVQRKVAIGDADDEYEREADSVANMVISATSSPYTHIAPSIRPISGNLGSGSVQGMMDDGGSGGASSGFESRLASTRGGGMMLPTETRSTMERGFGYDFSPVRIHTGAEADTLNRDVNARAFTSGLDIYFASGEYSPSSTEGQRLLAHELTHVVQQAGGSSGDVGVQRAKYGDCPPLGGTRLGNTFEGHLRDANPTTLITQGRVPGGITDVTEVDKVGKPDLYMSDPDLTLPGMKVKAGTTSTKTVLDASDFEVMNRGGAKSGGTINMAPTLSAGTWSGTFPQVKVGDIKPLSIYKSAEVQQQLSNYIEGYKEFLKNAKSTFPGLGVPTTPAVRISSITIPQGYDYDQFDVETALPKPSTPSMIQGNKRYWLVFDNNNGIIYYFCLTHPFKPGTSSQDLVDTFDALLPLKRSLRTRNASFRGSITPVTKKSLPSSRVATPAAPAAPGSHAARDTVLAAKAPSDAPSTADAARGDEMRDGTARKLVQRNGAHPKIQREKKKIDWDAKKVEWEKMREDWDTNHAKKYLNADNHKAYLERLEVDQELASLGFNPKPVKSTKDDVKKLKTIELWSGASGEQLIFWRAKLGGAFDLVADFLDKMREKFAGFKDKLNKKLGSMNVGKFESWKKKFLNILTEAAKAAFVQLLDALKDIFVNCMETVADKILQGIGEEVEGVDIVEDVKGIVGNVESFAKKVEKEFNDRFAEYDTLIDTLTDVKRWVSIISDLVTLARVIWQGISCLSPPGLGCLWGIAGQFAFSAVLSVMMEIQEFRDAISGMVLGLFGSYVGDRFKALMMWGLKEVGLDKYADPAACAPTDQAGGGGGGLGLITSPFAGGAVSDDEKLKELRKWEEENKDLLLRETLEGLKGEKGITLSSEQLLELLKALKDSGWTKEEIEKNLGSGDTPATYEQVMEKVKKAKEQKAAPEAEKPPGEEQKPAEEKKAPPPEEQKPPPEAPPQTTTSPDQGGEDKDKKDADAGEGSSVPVIDATKANEGTRGQHVAKYGVMVAAESGHTAHKSNPPIKVTVWIYEFQEAGDPVHILTLTNVDVVVTKRTWDPKGSNETTAERLVVHYKLVKPIALDPHLPGISLIGDAEGFIYGYIKYR